MKGSVFNPKLKKIILILALPCCKHCNKNIAKRISLWYSWLLLH